MGNWGEGSGTRSHYDKRGRGDLLVTCNGESLGALWFSEKGTPV